ncbi:MAG TPA: ubiquinol-cytochrome c reductase iron-sulfur subunit [Candidatus Dormibacteraeota bacterium]|nr:ubiquinol-cytochrome c reductase iron-sulfur subunit [Candidatus Dormibacteraeota bacterium]
MTDETTNAQDAPKRRHFLEIFLGASVTASLISFVYPVLRYMIPVQNAEPAADSALAGHLGDLKPNTGKIFRFGNRPALLVLTNDGKYHAMSAVCTHLNCTVQYRSDLHAVWCACHNGMYSVDGRNISGPPPRPLETYQVILKGDDIYVRRDENA